VPGFRSCRCRLPREQIAVGLAVINAIDLQLAPVDRELCSYARRQTGCKALYCHYAIGALTSVTILSELGDVGRFSSSREEVRYGGMDITVHASDKRRAPGRLCRQGPPGLRWALFEAALAATRERSPDRDYYRQAAARLGHNRACLAVARKLLKRCYHTLKELGVEGLALA
jgi:transposase